MEYYYRSHNEKVDPQVDPPLFDQLPRYGPTKTSKPRKALRVILASILTYLFMRFVISDVSSLIKNRHVQHREFRFGDRYSQDYFDSDQSLPEDNNMSVEECVSWSRPIQHGPGQFHSTGILTFPLTAISEKLSVISRGPLSAGLINIVQSNSSSSEINVSAIFNYDDASYLALAEVCLLKGAEGESGVGVFSRPPPLDKHNQRNLGFHITLELPADASTIKNLKTDTQFLAQQVDLSSVYLQSVSLETTYMPIFVSGLSTQSGIISSKYGPIQGTFISDKSLLLESHYSAIQADITLIDSQLSSSSPTELVLKNSKSPIFANLTLLSRSPSSGKDLSEGGKFKVTTQGSISPINLNLPYAPLYSSLDLTVSTFISPATVSLHPTYDGTFDVRTSLAAATVHYDEQDTKRRVRIYETAENVTVGSVQWREQRQRQQEEGRGRVVVENSIGLIDLFL